MPAPLRIRSLARRPSHLLVEAAPPPPVVPPPLPIRSPAAPPYIGGQAASGEGGGRATTVEADGWEAPASVGHTYASLRRRALVTAVAGGCKRRQALCEHISSRPCLVVCRRSPANPTMTRSVKAGLQAVHQELDAEGEVCQAASGRGDATNNSAVDMTQPMTASDLRRSSTKRSCPPLGWSRVSCQGRSFNGAIIFWFGFSSLGIVFSCRSRPRRGSHAPCEVHACMDSNAAAVPDLSKAAKRHTAGGCAHGRSLQIRSH